MSFITPQEFKRSTRGVNLSAYSGPDGDAALYRALDVAREKIDDYLGFPLSFHFVPEEVHPVLGQGLPIFPRHGPVRAVFRFQVLAWAAGGKRQVWTLPCRAVEQVAPGFQPAVFGNVFVDRTHGLVTVTSLAGALGFPWIGLLQQSGEITASYSAGYDLRGVGESMNVLSGVVTNATTPTLTTFSVTPGLGLLIGTGIPLTVGSASAVVSAVDSSNDLVTVSGLSAPPSVGAAVAQTDGTSFPAPGWLKELNRDAAARIITVWNALEATGGIGKTRIGGIEWSMKDTTMPDLPDNVKESLDRRFGEQSAEVG